MDFFHGWLFLGTFNVIYSQSAANVNLVLSGHDGDMSHSVGCELRLADIAERLIQFAA